MAKKSRYFNVMHQSKGDTAFDVINIILMAVMFCVFLYPLLFIVSASLSNPNAVWNGNVWLLPVEPSLIGYKYIVNESNIWLGFRNTIFYTVFGVCINLVMTVCAAYPLSRKDFFLRNFFMGLFVLTMYFSGGMIPTYMVVKKLGMVNTIWAMLIPNAVSIFNIIITRTYFQNSIPEELREASEIDGCNSLQFLMRIVLPLSGPILAVMALYYGVGHWNAFFNALIYLSKKELYPLQLFLRDILTKNQVNFEMLITDGLAMAEQQRIAQTMKYGIIIVSTLPILAVYPFVQRFFVKGVMIGALKG